jgi:Nuclease-related domain
MRVIELSDHPGDMLHDVSLRRQATQRRAQARHEDALIQHQARVQTIRVRRDRARRGRQWLTWLRLIVAVWAEQRRKPAGPQTDETDADTEQRIRAGIAGEQLVVTELGRALGDDWTLLRGYRNRRGEIDHLLLGPRGMFAIEVKNINATVHIDRDRWRADKYDNYGNLVEQREIADRMGRSPSEQLNEPAGELERFLRGRGQPVALQRVVVLTHRRSRVGHCRHPTVHVGVSPSYVLSLVRESTQELDERQRADAERLIRRDHDYHDRRRR